MNEFINKRKIAGEEMERLRNERLQKMDPSAGARLMGAVEIPSREDMYAHGLARWQSWMIRWRIQYLMQQVDTTETTVEGTFPDA